MVSWSGLGEACFRVCGFRSDFRSDFPIFESSPCSVLQRHGWSQDLTRTGAVLADDRYFASIREEDSRGLCGLLHVIV